jgi:hypothetical protein
MLLAHRRREPVEGRSHSGVAHHRGRYFQSVSALKESSFSREGMFRDDVYILGPLVSTSSSWLFHANPNKISQIVPSLYLRKWGAR